VRELLLDSFSSFLVYLIQSEPKVGIQRLDTIHCIPYTYFWPTLYYVTYCVVVKFK